MNTKQRESASKYLYDLSKGVLPAGGIALFAEKVGLVAFVIHFAVAFYAFVVAHWLEEEL
jgi:hypothetical protein